MTQGTRDLDHRLDPRNFKHFFIIALVSLLGEFGLREFCTIQVIFYLTISFFQFNSMCTIPLCIKLKCFIAERQIIRHSWVVSCSLRSFK